MKRRSRLIWANWGVLGGLVVASFAIDRSLARDSVGVGASIPAVERGRAVYIAEGCIHCHSQYVRPQTADSGRWGPMTDLASNGKGNGPVLFGNRRQGPDLANVGLRRSAEWNRLHLMYPRLLSPGSVMPQYRHLFDPGDSRGTDLVVYLQSLGGDIEPEVDDFTLVGAEADEDATRGSRLYADNCAQCHGSEGAGDGPVSLLLRRAPRDLRSGKWLFEDNRAAPSERSYLSAVIKFGLVGTSMPGHEYLSDLQINDLLAYLEQLKK